MNLKTPRVLNRKSKMVSFRVSSEEHERLRAFCVSKGQRSVSDLARLAVETILDNGEAPNLEARLCEVESRIHLLTREVVRITAPSVIEPVLIEQANY